MYVLVGCFVSCLFSAVDWTCICFYSLLFNAFFFSIWSRWEPASFGATRSLLARDDLHFYLGHNSPFPRKTQAGPFLACSLLALGGSSHLVSRLYLVSGMSHQVWRQVTLPCFVVTIQCLVNKRSWTHNFVLVQFPLWLMISHNFPLANLMRWVV